MTNGVAGHQCLVRILYCGQGMANFLEFSDLDAHGNATLRETALVDFGVDHQSAEYSAPAVECVCDRLATLRPPRIGFAVFSHQDTDHWGIIGPFLAEVQNRSLALKVGEIYYGGVDWSPKALAMLDNLARYSVVTRNKVKPLAADRSDYKGPRFPAAQLTNWGPIAIRVLCANIPVQTSGGLRKNGTSAVIVVECDQQTVLLPGDATYETFAYINNIFGMYGGQSPLHTCVAVNIPHHGAYASFGTYGDLTAGTSFARTVGANNAVASAGWRHHHPRKEILDIFAGFARKDGVHRWSAFPNGDAAAPLTYDTVDNVFTTRIGSWSASTYHHYSYALTKKVGQPLEVALTEHGPGGHERTVFSTRPASAT